MSSRNAAPSARLRAASATLLVILAAACGPAPEPRFVPERRIVDSVQLPASQPLRAGAPIILKDVSRPALSASSSQGVVPECPAEGPPESACTTPLPRSLRNARWVILAPGFHPQREVERAKLQELVAGPLEPPGHFLVHGKGPPPVLPRYEARGLVAHPVPDLDRRDYTTKHFAVPSGAVLRFAIGAEEPAWFVDSAPVEFIVKARAGDDVVELFREPLDPAHVEADRGWREHEVSLDRFAGDEIALSFEVRAKDPEDTRPQLPLWGDPTVFVPAPEKRRPAIVLVSLDTLRAQSLSALGYDLETSPYFEILAGEGSLFTDAFTTYSNTLGAHMSMLTGLYPRTHAVTDARIALSERKPTLAELLRAAGYETAAFTEDALLRADAGFRRGFARYEENKDVHPRGGDSAATFGKALDWARAHRDVPFFLFVHTYEVHAPYVPPEEYASLFAESAPDPARPPQRLLYEREIRHLDDNLRDLVAELDRIASAQDLLLVVTADHGEEFWEHGGFAHGKVYDEVMHVPLLLRWRGTVPAGQRIEEAVSLVDIVPTVLDLIGAPKAPVDGKSLVPLLEKHPQGIARSVVFAEAPASSATRQRRQFGARSATHKCIAYEGEPSGSCYDLRVDPQEKTPLDPALDATTRALFAELEAYRRPDGAAPSPPSADAAGEMDERQREKLRALGYVE